ncbi:MULTISPECIES: cytochrome b N-terminal domain-containing protein [unclassified Thalassospira]|uniref:cytochrome b n=1 Tax=unclassified Thalassospira TaxID=2648997 RepID=UPI001B04A8F3|nr:cytochrome b N-terminal domain-containing protein [Thalassospira sp.]MBO6773704.1 cytochrome b N-terminal domain-containing protein [Thalassospira sp.]
MMSAPQWNNKVVKWVDDRLPVISMLHHSAYEYPTPKNLSYMWNFGSLAGFVLVTMILTGVFLVMNYTPHTDMAFESVERIMRDVNHGWLIRYIHMNGASMFFICVFIHIFRGLYYGSYKAPREVLWWIGILILLAMMATAFMGYVLPWGQMSFWGATVITNLFSAFPIIGDPLVTWLWGGFSVDNPTLNRFFSLHYLMPFVILGLVVLHVWALHSVRSNNPTGVEIKTPQDSIPFHPYYTIKDLFGLGVFLIFFCAFVFFAPDYLGHPDNYIPANPLVTPPHIVPEWYFLPFYAILRSIDFTILGIPAKLLGVLAMFASIVILFVIPWLDTSKVRSSKFRPVYKWFFWLFVIDTFILGYCGAKAPDDYFMGIPGLKVIVMGQLSTLYYFAHFLVVMPLVGKLERTKPLPASISESVLKEGANA